MPDLKLMDNREPTKVQLIIYKDGQVKIESKNITGESIFFGLLGSLVYFNQMIDHITGQDPPKNDALFVSAIPHNQLLRSLRTMSDAMLAIISRLTKKRQNDTRITIVE